MATVQLDQAPGGAATKYSGFDTDVPKIRLVFDNAGGSKTTVRFQPHHVSPPALLRDFRMLFTKLGWNNLDFNANAALLPTTSTTPATNGQPHTLDRAVIQAKLGMAVHNGGHPIPTKVLRDVLTSFRDRINIGNFKVGGVTLTERQWTARAKALWNGVIADIKMQLIDPNSPLRIHRFGDKVAFDKAWADYAKQIDLDNTRAVAGSTLARSSAFRVGSTFGAGAVNLNPHSPATVLNFNKINSAADTARQIADHNAKLGRIAKSSSSLIDRTLAGKASENAAIRFFNSPAGRALKKFGTAALILDITTSSAQAATLADRGDTEGAANIIAKLSARIYFGFKGGAIGASAGLATATVIGPAAVIAALGGGFVGGAIGSYGGELAVDGIWAGAREAIKLVAPDAKPLEGTGEVPGLVDGQVPTTSTYFYPDQAATDAYNGLRNQGASHEDASTAVGLIYAELAFTQDVSPTATFASEFNRLKAATGGDALQDISSAVDVVEAGGSFYSYRDENGAFVTVVLDGDGNVVAERYAPQSSVKSATDDAPSIIRERAIDEDGKASGEWKTTVTPAAPRLKQIPLISFESAGGDITGSAIGSIFGSTIGQAIGGKNVFARVLAGSALATALATFAGGFGTTTTVDSLTLAISSADHISTAFAQNLAGQGIGAVSAFLTAELAEGLGIDTADFGGKLFSFVANTATNTLLKTAIVNVIGKNPILQGFSGRLFQFGIQSSAVFTNVSVGAFIGSYLGSQIVQPQNIAGSIGASALSSVGSLIGASQAVLNAVAAAIGAVGSAVATAVLSFVLPVIGSLIGYVFGAKIGNWLNRKFGIGADQGDGIYEVRLAAGSTATPSGHLIVNNDEDFGLPARELHQATIDILESLLPRIGAGATNAVTIRYQISAQGHDGADPRVKRRNYVTVSGVEGAGEYRNEEDVGALLGYGVHFALKGLDLNNARALPAAAISQLTTRDTTQIVRQVAAAIATQDIIDSLLRPFGGSITATGTALPNFAVNHATDEAAETFANAKALEVLKAGQLEFWSRSASGVWSRGALPWLTALLTTSTATTLEALALQIRIATEYHSHLDTFEASIGGRIVDRRLVTFNGVADAEAAQKALETELVTTLKGATIEGGNLYAKRALAQSKATTLAVLSGDVKTAEDYALFLANRPVIAELIRQNPDSAFAAGWLITLLRSDALNLGAATADDFRFGAADLLKSFGDAETAAGHFGTAATGAFATIEAELVPATAAVLDDAGETVTDAVPAQLRLIFARDAAGAATNVHVLPDVFALTGLAQLATASTGTTTGTSGADLWVAAADATAGFTVNGGAGHDVLVGSGHADTLNGGTGGDVVLAGAGDDVVDGGLGADVIQGGKGADTLRGGGGNDLYLYRRGDGADTITDSGGIDAIVLGVGITAGDLIAERAGNDLIVALKAGDTAFADLGDKITLKDWFDAAKRVESIVFADGDVLNAPEIFALTGSEETAVGFGAVGQIFAAGPVAVDAVTIRLDDSAFGSSVQHTAIGRPDTADLVFQARVGEILSVVTGTTAAKVEARDYRGATINHYLFSGTAWVIVATEIYDAAGALTSRQTFDADPTFVHTTDTLAFKPGLTVADVIVDVDGDDWIVGILPENYAAGSARPAANTLEHIRLVGQAGAAPPVKRFAFGDGTLISNIETLPSGLRALTALEGGSRVIGTAQSEVLFGRDGRDILGGGKGNDELHGTKGDDAYIFNRGDGFDRIFDGYSDAGKIVDAKSEDTLHFGRGIGTADLVFQISGNNLIVGVLPANHGRAAVPRASRLANRVQLERQINDKAIEKIAFADGSTSDLTVDATARTVTLTLKSEAGRAVTTYYVTGTRHRTVVVFNADDQKLSDIAYFNNGSRIETLYDVAGVQAWKQRTRTYNASGIVTVETGINDDDTPLVISVGNSAYTLGRGSDVITIDDASGIDSLTLADGLTAADITAEIVGDDLIIALIPLDHDSTKPVPAASTLADRVRIIGGSSVEKFLLFDGTALSDLVVSKTNSDGSRTETTVYFSASDERTHTRIAFDATNKKLSETTRRDDGSLVEITRNGDGSRIEVRTHLPENDVRVRTISKFDSASTKIEETIYRRDRGVIKTIFHDGGGRTMTGGAHTEILNGTHFGDRLDGGEGNDRLNGNEGRDTLIGGKGNDTLFGGEQSDTYVFSRGDGQDTVDDNGDADTDKLVIHGYLPNEVAVARSNGATLVLTFAGTTTDKITVINSLDGSITDGIEQIVFDDGTIWTMADVGRIIIAASQTDGNDTIDGFALDETLSGGKGNDILRGHGGNDTLIGGLGNDTLYGDSSGSGEFASDTYVFSRGDGQDVIEDNGFGGTDKLVIHGYLPNEVAVARSGDATLILTFAGTTDKITVINTLNGDYYDVIEQIVFDDGTIWTMPDVAQMIITASQTDGNDTIDGFIHNDTMSGGKGNDTLRGHDGNDTLIGGLGNDTLHGDSVTENTGSDTYVFSRGDGQDVIEDNGYAGTDKLVIHDYTPNEVAVARSGDATLILTFAGSTDKITVINTLNDDRRDAIEQIVFDDGTIWTMADVGQMIITASQTDGDDTIDGFIHNDTMSGGKGNDILRGHGGNDTLIGGLGNDTLHGQDGSDIYVFSRGDGQDVVDDNGFIDTDKLVIHGYLPNEVAVARSGDATLILTFAGTTDKITVINTLNDGYHDAIEQIVFDDGTIWTMADARRMIIAASQTDSNDIVTGFATADLLTGGLGNDTLFGGRESDIYVFSRGDGQDVIEDNGLFSTDKLVIHGYMPNDVAVARSGDATLILTFAGTTDKITVINTLNGSVSDQIEQIVFDDGTIWTMADANDIINNAGRIIPATEGNDVLNGTPYADTINGLGGDDLIDGKTGNDTHIGGPGNDTLFGNLGADTFDGGADIDTLDFSYTADNVNIDLSATKITFSSGQVETVVNVENVIAGAGNNSLTGDDKANRLDGGAGNDTLSGGAGNDTLIGGAGLDSFDGGADIDTVDFRHSSQAVTIDLAMGRAIFPVDDPDDDPVIETITNVENVIGSTGNNMITGDSKANRLDGDAGDDTITGGGGNDTLNGGRDSDTYIFSRSDGQDTIHDDGVIGTDTLKFGDEITEADLAFEISGNDLIVGVLADDRDFNVAIPAASTLADRVRLTNQIIGTNVERIAFIDNRAPTLAVDSTAQTVTLTEDDDTGRRVVTYHLGTSDARHRTVALFNSAEAKTSGTVHNDDGTRVETTYDVASSETWKERTRTYAADGTLTAETGVNDDDTTFTTDLTPPPAPAAAPIALDLDGDGVELVALSKSTARFDLDVDGVREHAGWVGRDDAWLAIDANGDGVISETRELVFTTWVDGTTSDLEAARLAFDTNNNDQLDAGDDRWSDFRVWQDTNQDGVSQTGELKTLDQAGITEINLSPIAEGQTALDDGSRVTATTTYTDQEGTKIVGDVIVAFEETPEDAILNRMTGRLGREIQEAAIRSAASEMAAMQKPDDTQPINLPAILPPSPLL